MSLTGSAGARKSSVSPGDRRCVTGCKAAWIPACPGMIVEWMGGSDVVALLAARPVSASVTAASRHQWPGAYRFSCGSGTGRCGGQAACQCVVRREGEMAGPAFLAGAQQAGSFPPSWHGFTPVYQPGVICDLQSVAPSLSALRSTLPTGVMGSWSRNSIRRGTL